MKILSLGKGMSFTDIKKHVAWIEQDGRYNKILIDENDVVEIVASLPVSDYRNYDHFTGVIGKFNPYTNFFTKPREVDLTYDALELELIKIRKEMKGFEEGENA